MREARCSKGKEEANKANIYISNNKNQQQSLQERNILYNEGGKGVVKERESKGENQREMIRKRWIYID